MRAGASSGWYLSMMESVAKASGFSSKTPVKDLDEEQINLILNGNNNRSVTIRHRTRRGQNYSWDTNFEGVIPIPSLVRCSMMLLR